MPFQISGCDTPANVGTISCCWSSKVEKNIGAVLDRLFEMSTSTLYLPAICCRRTSSHAHDGAESEGRRRDHGRRKTGNSEMGSLVWGVYGIDEFHCCYNLHNTLPSKSPSSEKRKGKPVNTIRILSNQPVSRFPFPTSRSPSQTLYRTLTPYSSNPPSQPQHASPPAYEPQPWRG